MSARESLLRLADLREVAEHNARDHGGVQIMDTKDVLALIAAVERARDLADLAAHVVCEPRRFHENEGNVQQLLGEAVARVRDTLSRFEFDHQSNEVASPVREDSETTSSTSEGV